MEVHAIVVVAVVVGVEAEAEVEVEEAEVEVLVGVMARERNDPKFIRICVYRTNCFNLSKIQLISI